MLFIINNWGGKSSDFHLVLQGDAGLPASLRRWQRGWLAGRTHAPTLCFPGTSQLWVLTKPLSLTLSLSLPFGGNNHNPVLFQPWAHLLFIIKISICKFCFRAADSTMILCYGININLVKCIVRFDMEDIFMLIRTGIVNGLLLELSH